MSKQMREEFEAAYMKDVSERFRGAEVDDEEWVARNNNGEYRSYRAAGAWWAWNASRESQPSTYTAVDVATAAADGFRDGVGRKWSLLDECRSYLQCIVDKSMSRNNAEALADELIEAIDSAKSATSKED